jgi:hypothetical protein
LKERVLKGDSVLHVSAAAGLIDCHIATIGHICIVALVTVGSGMASDIGISSVFEVFLQTTIECSVLEYT